MSWGQVLKLELFGQHSNHCPQNWWSRTNLPEILITGPALGGQEPAAVVSRATNIAEKGHKNKAQRLLTQAFKSQGVEGRARDCCEQRWLFRSDCSKCQLGFRPATLWAWLLPSTGPLLWTTRLSLLCVPITRGPFGPAKPFLLCVFCTNTWLYFNSSPFPPILGWNSFSYPFPHVRTSASKG